MANLYATVVLIVIDKDAVIELGNVVPSVEVLKLELIAWFHSVRYKLGANILPVEVIPFRTAGWASPLVRARSPSARTGEAAAKQGTTYYILSIISSSQITVSTTF
jgi:hypothetical protein